MIYPSFIDHLVFRVADLAETERFYTKLLGQPSEKAEESLMYLLGNTRLFYTSLFQPAAKPYEKEEIGLNHIAFGMRTLDELKILEAQLDDSGLPHSGIKMDHYGLKEFIWLDDPDGIRVEFYLRPL